MLYLYLPYITCLVISQRSLQNMCIIFFPETSFNQLCLDHMVYRVIFMFSIYIILRIQLTILYYTKSVMYISNLYLIIRCYATRRWTYSIIPLPICTNFLINLYYKKVMPYDFFYYYYIFWLNSKMVLFYFFTSIKRRYIHSISIRWIVFN